MNSFKVIAVCMIMVFLVGCGRTVGNSTPEDIIEEASVVVSLNGQQLLADETMWRLTDKTKVRSQIGEKVTAEDIQAGHLIRYRNEGPIMESYPMQGTLGEVTLFNDDYSLKVSSAISYFLANQPEGDILKVELISIEENILTIEIQLWNLEANQRFSVEIDLGTKDFRMTEVKD